MRSFLCLLALPLLVAAAAPQPTTNASSTPSAATSQPPSQTLSPIVTVIESTSVISSVGLGPNRQLTTLLTTVITNFTETILPTSAAVTGGNITSSSTTTTPVILPTAPTNINGGGGAGGGAPYPGETGAGGQYGPNDGYIAAAASLKRNTLFVGLGVVVGGVLVML